MDYRSQVRCLIYSENKDDLDAFITTKALIDGDQVFRDFKDSLTRYTVQSRIFRTPGSTFEDATLHVLDLYGDGWKWYEGYEDVDAWMKLVDEIEHESDAYPGLLVEFIRIGENPNDIDRRSSEDNCDLLTVSCPQIEDTFDKIDPQPLSL